NVATHAADSADQVHFVPHGLNAEDLDSRDRAVMGRDLPDAPLPGRAVTGPEISVAVERQAIRTGHAGRVGRGRGWVCGVRRQPEDRVVVGYEKVAVRTEGDT